MAWSPRHLIQIPAQATSRSCHSIGSLIKSRLLTAAVNRTTCAQVIQIQRANDHVIGSNDTSHPSSIVDTNTRYQICNAKGAGETRTAFDTRESLSPAQSKYCPMRIDFEHQHTNLQSHPYPYPPAQTLRRDNSINLNPGLVTPIHL